MISAAHGWVPMHFGPNPWGSFGPAVAAPLLPALAESRGVGRWLLGLGVAGGLAAWAALGRTRAPAPALA